MDPFIGEVRAFSFGFAPPGWAFCNGQELPINQNDNLFKVLGTRFGGNGQTTFKLPDLRGRTPIGMSADFSIGVAGGELVNTLTTASTPLHNHTVNAVPTPATTGTPGANVVLAAAVGAFAYGTAQNMRAMDPTASVTVGGGQPHGNVQPYLVLNFCIALKGGFPR